MAIAQNDLPNTHQVTVIESLPILLCNEIKQSALMNVDLSS